MEKGQHGFTLPDVAARAGVTVRTVYQRFASREDLLMTVFDRIYAEQDDAWLSAWTTTDWAAMGSRELVERLVRDLARMWREQEPLMRAIMGRRLAVGDDDVVFRHGVEDITHGARAFERAVLASGHPIAQPDPRRTIAFAYRMIIAMSARWTAHEVETLAPERLEWAAMLDELCEAVTRYLFGAS